MALNLGPWCIFFFLGEYLLMNVGRESVIRGDEIAMQLWTERVERMVMHSRIQGAIYEERAQAVIDSWTQVNRERETKDNPDGVHVGGEERMNSRDAHVRRGGEDGF